MSMGNKWIAGAIKKPGALHKSLGIPEGKKIGITKINIVISKLRKKADEGKLSPKELLMSKRANLAKTLSKFK